MSAERLMVSMSCCCCGAVLRLYEMHYYADEEGNANCEACEKEWSDQMLAFMRGDGPMPTHHE
jgi:hypothetical protein